MNKLSIGDAIFLSTIWLVAGFLSYYIIPLISEIVGIFGIIIVFGGSYEVTKYFLKWKKQSSD